MWTTNLQIFMQIGLHLHPHRPAICSARNRPRHESGTSHCNESFAFAHSRLTAHLTELKLLSALALTLASNKPYTVQSITFRSDDDEGQSPQMGRAPGLGAGNC